jgi:hypothetical protein
VRVTTDRCASSRSAPWRAAAAASVGVLLVAGTVRAQPSAADAALAETLFQEAQRLMQDGDYAQACPKLVESQRLDPGTGTLLNLARCYEGEGRTASAWSIYHEALAAALQDGRTDRVAYAEAHIVALEPKLSRLVISVDPEAPGDIQVTLDDVIIGRAAWSTAAPVDPGVHRVRATAPGRKVFFAEVVVKADQGETLTVEVPVLELESPPPTGSDKTAAPAHAPAPSRAQADTAAAATLPGHEPVGAEPSSTELVLGYGLGGLGLAAVGVGTYFGMRAIWRWDDRSHECDATGCSQTGVDAGEDAQSAALVADVAIPAGVIMLGIGGYLLYSAYTADDRDSGSSAFRLEPSIGPHGASVAARGAF